MMIPTSMETIQTVSAPMAPVVMDVSFALLTQGVQTKHIPLNIAVPPGIAEHQPSEEAFFVIAQESLPSVPIAFSDPENGSP